MSRRRGLVNANAAAALAAGIAQGKITEVATGSDAAFNSGEVLYPGYFPNTTISIQDDITVDQSADGYAGLLIYTNVNIPTDSTRILYAIDAEIIIDAASTKDLNGLTALYAFVQHSGSGDVSSMQTAIITALNDAVGLVIDEVALTVDADGGGNATVVTGIRINAQGGTTTKAIEVLAGDVSIEVDNGLAFVNQTGVIGLQAGTLLNAPTAGNPFWLRIKKAGANFAIPIWAVP